MTLQITDADLDRWLKDIKVKKVDAVAANDAEGPVHIPTHFSPNVLVDTLGKLLQQMPTSISAAASKGEPLRASGHKFTVGEIDAVLSARGVDISDRIRLKAAMSQNGLL